MSSWIDVTDADVVQLKRFPNQSQKLQVDKLNEPKQIISSLRV